MVQAVMNAYPYTYRTPIKTSIFTPGTYKIRLNFAVNLLVYTRITASVPGHIPQRGLRTGMELSGIYVSLYFLATHLAYSAECGWLLALRYNLYRFYLHTTLFEIVLESNEKFLYKVVRSSWYQDYDEYLMIRVKVTLHSTFPCLLR